jgi:cell division protein FtsB
MASRAHAARRASTARRRPAARKRRPAARRGGTRIKWDRIGRIALVVVLGAVIYSYLNPAIDFVKTYTATTAAKAKLHEQLRENRKLHQAVQSADEPIVVDRKARAQGMVTPGETPIVVRGLGG